MLIYIPTSLGSAAPLPTVKKIIRLRHVPLVLHHVAVLLLPRSIVRFQERGKLHTRTTSRRMRERWRESLTSSQTVSWLALYDYHRHQTALDRTTCQGCAHRARLLGMEAYNLTRPLNLPPFNWRAQFLRSNFAPYKGLPHSVAADFRAWLEPPPTSFLSLFSLTCCVFCLAMVAEEAVVIVDNEAVETFHCCNFLFIFVFFFHPSSTMITWTSNGCQ